MATLTRTGRILMFDDTPSNRNPIRRHADWQQSLQALPVLNPQGAKEFPLLPGEEATLWSGVRTLTANGSTAYDVTLSSLDPSRYRLTWTGVGADPGFRTARTVVSSPGNLLFALQANQTVKVTSSLGAIFGAVVVGDNVMVPGVVTGDPAVFDPLNEGLWEVLAKTSTELTLRRPADATFSGVTETVAVTSDDQFLAYSAAGVQVGDLLDLVSGFAGSSLRSYPVVAVTSLWVEFSYSMPLAEEAAVVPGASGLAVYSAAKRYVYLEADQEVAVKLNGDTGEHNRVEPIAGAGAPGWFEKFGTVYSLVVKNRSTASAVVVLISAE
jgi:hypothetical protein